MSPLTATSDLQKFPYGMENFTATIKALGISASAYSDNGYETCAGLPGSFDHEIQDLTTRASWGFDYVKYDNCYSPFDNITQANQFGRYQCMSDAIATFAKSTHSKPFEHSLCNGGWEKVWIWSHRLSHSWRINGDIKPWWSSIAAIIDQASFSYWATDFYGRNDLDIMEVGNTDQGTPAWALLKSPLIIGTDLTNTSNPYLKANVEILKNEDLIKVNRDPHLGQSISPFRWGVNPDYVSNPKQVLVWQ
jgi:alpha-galactosidase